MSLHVALSPGGLDPGTLDRQAVLMIDVFRASTTIVTALANGARAVIPVADKGEAGRLAATLDRDMSVMAGERGGQQLAGFGNSPRSFTPEAVRGRTIVLTTTNGTAALVKARGAERLAVGALANATAATAFLVVLLPGLALSVGWAGWLFWVGMILLVIRVDHPPVLIEEPLTPLRKALGILCIVIFLLCFSIQPLQFITG